MKKNVILLLLIGNLVWSQSQKLSGIIKDSETLQPIAYVNIFSQSDLQNNTTGSISNENGEFSITNTDSKITFSHINYETLTINADASFKEILLKPKFYVLDEIVLSNENPRDYLKRIIDLSSKKIEKNTLLKTYCREIVKVNNEYTKFSDALVDYYVKKGNGKSNLILGQHRALKSDKLTDEESDNVENINSVFNVSDYVKSAYKFESVERLLKKDEYEFVRKLKKEANGDEYEYIEIIPKDDSDELLNAGYVIVNPKTKNILEFKIYTSEKHLKNAKIVNILIAKVKVNKLLAWSKFKIINEQYILTYNKKQIDVYFKIGKRVDHDFEFTTDLFVYEFKNNVEIPKNEYKKKSLYEAGTDYTEDFWKKYNVFPLSDAENKFINSIQKN